MLSSSPESKTHACVRQLALDAWQAGLAVWVALDAVGSDDPLHAAITCRYLEARGVEFITVAELTARFDNQLTQRRSGGAALIEAKVAAARFALNSWRSTGIEARTAYIQALHKVLATRVDQLAVLMAEEVGIPVRFGCGSVQRSLDMLLRVIHRAKNNAWVAETHGEFAVRRRPHGALAVITPWNNPIYIPLTKIIPAIVCGNAVVWKPAPETRLVSRILFHCLAEAGWPEGLVSLLEGGQSEARSLMNHESVAAVTITGSSAAGFVAQEICARRQIPLQAELGGNNAAIVWCDANLPTTARMIAAGAFEMAGQRCTANRRVIVHEACFDAFMTQLSRETAALNWGDPLNNATDIGPLVNVEHRNRVSATLDRVLTACAALLLPLGHAPPNVEADMERFIPRR